MTRKLVVIVVLLLAISGAAIAIRRYAFTTAAPNFRFVTVERGDVQATVSATGTLNAVTTINVGTQVSGQVAALFADFNDRVRKGQLLARIDSTIAQQGVADAQANLERLRAQTNQAARDQDRTAHRPIQPVRKFERKIFRELYPQCVHQRGITGLIGLGWQPTRLVHNEQVRILIK